MEIGDRLQKQRGHPTEEDERGSTTEDSQVNGGVDLLAVSILAKRIRNRCADDEQEERKDEVCRSPSMPGSVIQRPVLRPLAPFAWVVDQDHGENRGAAEDVEREEATTANLRGRRFRRHR